MRRQFDLPQGDRDYLESLGLPFETIIDQGAQWVLVHDRPVRVGYVPDRAMTGIRIPPSYSDAALDMVYFFPALVRADGNPIAAVSPATIDGKSWQQWSRHRTGQNPWRPGVDDLAGHLVLVDSWLERELRKG